MIHGGDAPGLRTGHTLTALEQLGANGFITPDVQRDLAAAYIFLRNIEHGLQVAQGQQTHSLSGTERGLLALARRLGFDDLTTLTSVLERHRERVHGVYADLFHDAPSERGSGGRDMFRLLAGEMSDDDGHARLASAGVENPRGALDAIRALDAAPAQGRASARNLLANLLGSILSSETRLADPGPVLIRFEQVGVPRGRPERPLPHAARGRRAAGPAPDQPRRRRAFRGAPRGVSQLLDFLAAVALDLETFRAAVAEAFGAVVSAAGTSSPASTRSAASKVIEEFKVLAEWLAGRRLDRLNDRLSLVADCAIEAAARAAARERPPDPDAAEPEAGWTVFALGKLGGRELTVHSDLDLVFVYAGETTDAPRFERHQKFVRAIHDLLSRKTAAGSAYEFDTRLRPEGRMGALAIPLPALERYLRERAEIWERMAWTRRRPAGGEPALGERVRETVDRFVYGPWAPGIPSFARHVRARIEHELAREAAGDHLDLKRGRGGLADIDFLLQVLQIREGAEREQFRVAGSRALLAALPETDFLRPAEAVALRGAYAFLRELETVLRIHTDTGGGTIPTDPGALEPLARRLGEPLSGAELLARYRDVTAEVRSIYDTGMDRLASQSG